MDTSIKTLITALAIALTATLSTVCNLYPLPSAWVFTALLGTALALAILMVLLPAPSAPSAPALAPSAYPALHRSTATHSTTTRSLVTRSTLTARTTR